jgi:hypothetical protein
MNLEQEREDRQEEYDKLTRKIKEKDDELSELRTQKFKRDDNTRQRNRSPDKIAWLTSPASEKDDDEANEVVGGSIRDRYIKTQ